MSYKEQHLIVYVVLNVVLTTWFIITIFEHMVIRIQCER